MWRKKRVCGDTQSFSPKGSQQNIRSNWLIKADNKLNKNIYEMHNQPCIHVEQILQHKISLSKVNSRLHFPKMEGSRPSANIPSFFQMHRMHAYICYLRQSHDISKSCLLFIFTVMETLACNWLPATYMHLQGNGFFMGRNHNRSILDGHIYIYRSTDHSEHYAPCFCLL